MFPPVAKESEALQLGLLEQMQTDLQKPAAVVGQFEV
jgi:hypothetical protein